MFLLQSNETKHKKVTCVGEIWLWVLFNAQNGLCFLSTMGSMDVIIPSQMAECLPSTIWKARTWATVGGRYIVRSAPPPGCQRRCSLPLQVPRLRWLQHQARLSLQAAREQRNTASSSPPSSQTTPCEMRSWGGRFWLDGRELMGMGAEEKPVLIWFPSWVGAEVSWEGGSSSKHTNAATQTYPEKEIGSKFPSLFWIWKKRTRSSLSLKSTESIWNK